MKITQEILDLPIICIEEGTEFGRIKDFFIDPDRGAITYLVIDDGKWYAGAKLLPFDKIMGIGIDAVTTETASHVTSYTEEPLAQQLAEKAVRIIGTRVYTKKGLYIGTISEYFISEEDGKIVGCQLEEGQGGSVIPSASIVTYGRNVLVVDEDVQESMVDRLDGGADQCAATIETVEEVEDQIEEEMMSSQIELPVQEDLPVEEPMQYHETENKASKLFEQRQRKFLVGRKASKRISADDGSVIIEDGEVITDALIDVIKNNGKLIELTMNTKA